MTDEAPVLRWDAHRLVLVDAGGYEVTDAQDAKARRYVKDGKIHRDGNATMSGTGYGSPSRFTQAFKLHPIPGCREVRRVVVVDHYDAASVLAHRDFKCNCQAARGSKVAGPRSCSHALAVHRFLRAEVGA